MNQTIPDPTARTLQHRTVWSDTAWLSTVSCADEKYDTRFFAPDRYRAAWRVIGVYTDCVENALHNHDLIAQMIDDDNQHRRGRIVRTPFGVRCALDFSRPRRWSPWHRSPLLHLPPWVQVGELESHWWALGYTQPAAHPLRHLVIRSS